MLVFWVVTSSSLPENLRYYCICWMFERWLSTVTKLMVMPRLLSGLCKPVYAYLSDGLLWNESVIDHENEVSSLSKSTVHLWRNPLKKIWLGKSCSVGDVLVICCLSYNHYIISFPVTKVALCLCIFSVQ